MQADLAHRILILTNNLDRFSACAYFRRLSRPWQLIPLAVANTIISLTKSMGRTYSYSWFGGANAHVPYIQVEPANFVRHASGHQLASRTITHANRRCAMMGDRQPLLFVRTTDGMRGCWYITLATNHSSTMEPQEARGSRIGFSRRAESQMARPQQGISRWDMR